MVGGSIWRELRVDVAPPSRAHLLSSPLVSSPLLSSADRLPSLPTTHSTNSRWPAIILHPKNVRGNLGKGAMQKIKTHYVLQHYVHDQSEGTTGANTFTYILHQKVSVVSVVGRFVRTFVRYSQQIRHDHLHQGIQRVSCNSIQPSRDFTHPPTHSLTLSPCPALPRPTLCLFR